jgi:hypothetical protein
MGKAITFGLALALIGCNDEIGDTCRVVGCSAPLVCETTGDFSRYCTVHCEHEPCPGKTECFTAPGGAICMPPEKAAGWSRVPSPPPSGR